MFIVNESSFGPGYIPNTTTFSHLNRTVQGRLNSTKCITPKEYSVLLNELNRSTLNVTPIFLLSRKNGLPSSSVNYLYIIPSYTSINVPFFYSFGPCYNNSLNPGLKFRGNHSKK